MLRPAIDNHASWKIRVVICFLHAKNRSSSEIHRQQCAVYGQSVMSEGALKHCCRMFKDGRTNIHDEERSGRPSVVSDLVQSGRLRFTTSEFSCEFTQFSHTLL
jgi:hypothetical protein